MTPEDRMRRLGSRDADTPTESDWVEFRARGHRAVRNRRIAAAVGSAAMVVAIAIGAYALTGTTDDDGPGPGPATSPTVTDSPTPESSPTDPSPSPVPKTRVRLQQWFFDERADGKMTVFYEEVTIDGEDPGTVPMATAAMDLLLRGPSGPLGETGVTSAIPEGTELLDLSIEDGTAIVDLNEPFLQEDGFTERMGQVVYTLTQFPRVEKVNVLIEGSGPPPGAADQTRVDFDSLLPPIVVEAPQDGQEIERGQAFVLSGIANVFEATVTWRLVQDGAVIDEGFTTATCGTGCWGTFEESITIRKDFSGTVVLEVFEASAEDGSPLHMVSVPLNF